MQAETMRQTTANPFISFEGIFVLGGVHRRFTNPHPVFLAGPNYVQG